MRIEFYFIMFVLFSCGENNTGKNDSDFYIGTFGSVNDVRLLDPQDVVKIVHNVYKIDSVYYLGIEYQEKQTNSKNDIIKSRKKGIFLMNQNEILNESGIDIPSYEWIIPNHVSKDKKRVYFFPKTYEIPSVIILKLNPNNTVLVDTNATYLKDDSLVFCIPSNSYMNVDAENFQAEYIDGYAIGTDGNNSFEYDRMINVDSLKSQ